MISSLFRSLFLTLLSIATIGLSGCSTLSSTDDPNRFAVNDPYEGFNRSINSFNTSVDKAVVRPVARGYKAVVPDGARKSVGNFFNNLSEPFNVVHNFLQGDINNGFGSIYRFVVNSTVGVIGLFDVATTMGVEEDNEDLGQTLAAWGVQPGPYLVLPFLGPSNMRDAISQIVDVAVYQEYDIVTDNSSGQSILLTTDLLDTRTNLLGLDSVLDSQPDPYAFLKIGFENNRLEDIYDGDAPSAQTEDFDDF